MLQRYLFSIRFAVSIMALAAWVAEAQGVKGSPPSPSQQVTRGNGDGTGVHGPQLQHRNRRYQLHSADVLALNFPFTPEFNQTVTVQPDGYITLRGEDGIPVEGRRPSDVNDCQRSA